MTRFSGAVGFGEPIEIDEGVYDVKVTERQAFGDVVRSYRNNQDIGKLNANINFDMAVSVVADDYLKEHLDLAVYVRWGTLYLAVTSVEMNHPRITLTLGGVWHGPKAELTP